uniref:Uncharacterized protein n=1 Tax=Glossina pallidipes TaxID=7398 RepID=A0A1B0A8P3_GLOPL
MTALIVWFKRYAITRSLTRSTVLRQSLSLSEACTGRHVAMKIVPVDTVTKKETFFEKNARLGREMSPHLTIYQPQLTSLLSVTHRGTGMVLTAGVWALGLAALISPQDIGNYASVIEGLHLGGGTLTVLKFMFAFPLAFHTANGVRHLLWDTGRFLKIKEVYSTGYVMVGMSFVLAAMLAVM